MIVGFGFLRAITPNLGALTSKEQALEGAFRFLHSRLRTHAESVAFFGGGDREKAMVQVRRRRAPQGEKGMGETAYKMRRFSERL